MSPTIFKIKGFRFFFFSREETRKHVHVMGGKGEAKYWLEPTVSLKDYTGLSKVDLNRIQKIVEERKDEIIKAWKKHFGC